jgi:DNA-nicking Smr family endonuclease
MDFQQWSIQDQVQFLKLCFPHKSTAGLEEYLHKNTQYNVEDILQYAEDAEEVEEAMVETNQEEHASKANIEALQHMFPGADIKLIKYCLERNAGDVDGASEDILAMMAEQCEITGEVSTVTRPPMSKVEVEDYLHNLFPNMTRKRLYGYYLKCQDLDLTVDRIIKGKLAEQELNDLCHIFPLESKESIQELINENDFDKVIDILCEKDSGDSSEESRGLFNPENADLYEMFPYNSASYINALCKMLPKEIVPDWIIENANDESKLPVDSDNAKPKPKQSSYSQVVKAKKTEQLSEMTFKTNFDYKDLREKDYKDLRDKDYKDLRDKANEAYKQSQEYFQQAMSVYNKGPHGKETAAYYAEQGRILSRKIKERNQEASEQIFKLNNPNYKNTNTIDLHGLYVNEAIKIVNECLDYWAYKYNNIKNPPPFVIITGRGRNSESGQSKLRGILLKHLLSKKWNVICRDPGSLSVLGH